MTRKHDEAPAERDAEVYELFGFVKHLVQTWEEHLAAVWIWAMLPKTDADREAEGKAARKAVERVEHAFSRLTPQQARKDLGGELAPDALEAVEALLPVRNELAHRFLARRASGDGSFVSRTLAELRKLADQFRSSLDMMHAHLEATPGYAGPVRKHWPAVASAVISTLASGEPLDYRAVVHQARVDAGLDV